MSDTSHEPDDYYTITAGFHDSWCFPTRKNSTLTSLLSRATVYAQERGLIDSIYSKYYPQVGISASLSNSSPVPGPITVGMICTTLIILSIGLTLGLAAFIIEKLQLLISKRDTTSSVNSSSADMATDTKITEERIAPWMKACEDAMELIKKKSGNQRTENQLVQEYLNYLHAWNATHADLPIIPPQEEGDAADREVAS